LFLIPVVTFSQAPRPVTSADIYLGIKKLNVLGSVLYLAAHPDDENTRLIAYLSKEKLYRTGYLSMTRGDGGQNLIGEEQGIELGLIRTQELLSARRIDGGEQFFTRAFDFGYSKSPEETCSKWDKDKILSDVVWVIRKFQPDIVITRFPTTGEGGHGHHTASAILANEAFDAAADPSRFPGQLKYVQPWQVKRVLWNTFNFGGTNTIRSDQFKVDVGGYNPLLGKSYGEISAESRSQHKSQGFGVPASRGEAFEYFRATKGTQPASDLMEGVVAGWSRVKGAQAIPAMVDRVAADFDFLHPEYSVKSLLTLYRAIEKLAPGTWRNKKLEETKWLIGQCSGLWMDAFTSQQFAVQTDSVRINFWFNNRLGVNAELTDIRLDKFDTVLNKKLVNNKNEILSKTIYVPSTKPLTQPYWLEEKMDEGHFNVSDQQLIGIPDVIPSYQATVDFIIDGEALSFTIPVKYRFTDPVQGEQYWPLVVSPPVIVSPTEDLKIVINNREKLAGDLSLKGMKSQYTGRMVAMDAETQKKLADLSFNDSTPSISRDNQSLDVAYTLNADKYSGEIVFGVSDKESQKTYSYDMHEIKYDHIPAISYFHKSSVVVRSIDLETYGKKIGYIVGAGDKVPEALEQMGFSVTLLGDKELSRNDLNQYDAIISGIRAYNTNDWISNHYDKLMKYVEQGGNYIVQYNTISFNSNLKSRIGPYPFTISRSRVTDEKAAVRFLQPDHSVLNFPNKIGQDDFQGWIQERSIYDVSDTDSEYEKILSMSDPGENPDEGSLIVARYGRGYFSYTGLVFFRELPAGVPGAYRLLANLIALNRKKAF